MYAIEKIVQARSFKHNLFYGDYLTLALYLPYVQGLFTMTNNGNSLPLVPVAAYNS